MGLFSRKPLTSFAKRIALPDLRKRVKIVVIDDDPNAFPLQALRDSGYTIDTWDNVKSLERLEQGDFDIIVLDISGVAAHVTPDDGLGVLEHIKKVNPSQIVVAFSGQSFDLGKQKFFRMADDSLPKPADHLKCKQILDQLIEKKFTVEHLWASVAGAMARDGVSDKGIAKIEKQISKAIASGGQPDYGSIITEVTGKAELGIKVIGTLVKIGALCGL